MVKKETCPCCKGDKIVRVSTPSGTKKVATCPECAGQGWKVKVVTYI